MAKNKEIALNNSNLYLKGFGKDTNGNSVVKLTFPNQRGFSIQTNGNLPATHGILMYGKKLDELTQPEIDLIELESAYYIKNHGSKKQTESLRLHDSLKDEVAKFEHRHGMEQGGKVVKEDMNASDLEIFKSGGQLESLYKNIKVEGDKSDRTWKFDVGLIVDGFYHDLSGWIYEIDSDEWEAQYANELYVDSTGDEEQKTFKTYSEAEKWVLAKMKADIKEYYQEYGAGKQKETLKRGGKISKEDAIVEALKMGVDFDKDFHAQSFGNELADLAKRTGYRKSKSSSGSLGRVFFDHLDRIYQKAPALYKGQVATMKRGGELKNSFKSGGTIYGFDVENILSSFIEAGLWASHDFDSGDNLDENYDFDDVSEESKEKIRTGIKQFLNDNHKILKKLAISEDSIGHDLFLDSQGHGVGFWDRGYGKDGETLSKSASAIFTEDSPYVGDDKKVYFKKGGTVSGALKKRIDTANKYINFAIEKGMSGYTDFGGTVESIIEFTKPIRVQNQYVYVEYDMPYQSPEKTRYNLNKDFTEEELRSEINYLIRAVKKGAKENGITVPKFKSGGTVQEHMGASDLTIFKIGGSIGSHMGASDLESFEKGGELPQRTIAGITYKVIKDGNGYNVGAFVTGGSAWKVGKPISKENAIELLNRLVDNKATTSRNMKEGGETEYYSRLVVIPQDDSRYFEAKLEKAGMKWDSYGKTDRYDYVHYDFTKSDFDKHKDLIDEFAVETEEYKRGGKTGSEIVLRRLHPNVAVQPFIPYYERMGYKVTTRVDSDGFTKILATK